ncbi:MAG: hypothetical protein M1827_004172 [Pycnora praestabilis]|nr:MAG: hypothetical protein M1827_004172 [Pycnora praestabilis]
MPSKVLVNGLTTSHVPAWKKLGLKLKFAKDDGLREAGSLSSIEAPSKKRKLSSDGFTPANIEAKSNTATKPSKIQKKSKLDLPSAIKTNNLRQVSIPQSSDPDTNHSSLSQRPSTPSLKKQKSVTFTPDTKIEDGDSVKQLFKAWVAEKKSEKSTLRPEHVGKALKSDEHPQVTSEEIESKSKPAKKPKTENNQRRVFATTKSEGGTSADDSRVHSVVFYLQQYHFFKSEWKFNKIKQTYLLKHLLDMETIPADNDEALGTYIAGLQGKAARARVRETAKSISKGDEETWEEADMEDREKRKDDYNAAVNSFIARLKGQEKSGGLSEEDMDAKDAKRLAKRKRAERLILSLDNSEEGQEPKPPQGFTTLPNGSRVLHGEGDDVGQEPQKRMKLNDGSTQKTGRRRRKRRTGVPDDDTSNSDPSSSDRTVDTESDTEVSETSDTVDSSSSSSSSSSSNSDSSSGSGSDETSSAGSGSAESGSESDDDDSGSGSG